MRQSNQTRSLLDFLAEKTGCNYISDLTRASVLPKIKEIIRGVEASEFCLKEWRDAVYYIAKEETPLDTAEQAKGFLLQFNR